MKHHPTHRAAVKVRAVDLPAIKRITALAVLCLASASMLALAPRFAHAADTDSALPAAAQQGNVQFLSGGVGLDESTAIKRAAPHWPLSLSFIGGTRDYVSDVGVKITQKGGGDVLVTTSQGPYMLVRLKPGQYTVQATYLGKAQSHSVTVPASGHVASSFSWAHR